MFGRTPNEAVANYTSSAQRAVACVVEDIVRAGDFRTAEPSPALILSRGQVVPLRGALPSLGFRMGEFYRVIEDQDAPSRRRWRLLVTGYMFAFESRDTEQELLAFHWHPHIAEKAFPHVHLESGLGIQRDFVGIHVPTGSIALEDVIRFAIEELRVRPRVRNWAAILERTHAERDAG